MVLISFPKILELVGYLARSVPEEERAAFVAQFQDAVKSEEGKPPIEEDVERRKAAVKSVAKEVKGLGDGSEKGAYVIQSCLHRYLIVYRRDRRLLQPPCRTYLHSLPCDF